MLRRGSLVGVALALCAGGAAPARANEATSPGCTVRLLSVDARNVPTFRGECVWTVAPAWVAAVLTDPARLEASSTALEESRRLADGRIVNRQKTGWPMDDRQSTVVVEDEPLPGGGVRRRYRLAERQEPPASGVVQVAVDEGTWEIAPHPEGTRLVLEMRYEPGGNLPTRIVQSQSPRYIAKGLDELRVFAEKLASASASPPDVASGPPTP